MMEPEKMNCGLLAAAIVSALLTVGSSAAVAADKVVVIPLMSSAAGSDEIIHNGVRYGTVTSLGKIWLDRNLGAVRVAGSVTDSLAYGYLYQWGRGADGHENRTSPTTAALSATDTPGHGSFITNNGAVTHYDWRNPQKNGLWQGAIGINNPCPAGFRLPTATEWATEMNSWGSGNQNAAGAYASPLKLVVAGYHDHNDGSVRSAGSVGFYWSSDVDGIGSRGLSFDVGNDGVYGYTRADGFSVRCLKD